MRRRSASRCWSPNGVSKQDYDNAVSSQDQAAADVAFGNAAVQTARINLGYTDVIAPITGRVGMSQVTEGAYVQASAATLMTTIQQIDPIYVDLNQSSVQGLQLRRDIASGKVKITGPNQAKVTIFLEDGTQYPIAGTLQFTDITVDQNTGSVTVRAIVPNPNYVLLPGMFVRARIEGRRRRQRAARASGRRDPQRAGTGHGARRRAGQQGRVADDPGNAHLRQQLGRGRRPERRRKSDRVGRSESAAGHARSRG